MNGDEYLTLDRLCLDLAGMELIKEFRYFRKLDSTNNKAKELLSSGELQSEALILSEIQTAGKGRRGRTWISPPGGLWFTLVLQCPPATEHMAVISLASALAVASGLDAHLPQAADLKWPNDVQAGGRKIAGILVETSEHSEMGPVFIIGVGINVNNDIDDQSGLKNTAVSVKECSGKEVRLENVLMDVLKAFEIYYAYFMNGRHAELINLFKKRCSHMGQEVRIRQDDGEMTALCLDIASDGSLVVEEASGRKRHLSSGDISLA